MTAVCACGSKRAPKFKHVNRDGVRVYYCRDCGYQRAPITDAALPVDKKVGEVRWRDWTGHLKGRQELDAKASWSQKEGTIEIHAPYRCIVYKPMADIHIGSLGTDYDTLTDFTDGLVGCPWLYSSLTGDDTDNFSRFKNLMPVLHQGMPPDVQDAFLADWVSEIAHKMLFATWGNHAEFEEKDTGRNTVKKVLSHRLVYFDGIGVANLKLGEQTYKVAVTHKTRFHSSFNKTHGLKQLARRDIPDADIYIAGDKHDPAYEVSFERGREQVFILLGTLKRKDTFGERYFSFYAAQRDAAVVLFRDEHRAVPFPSLRDAMEFADLVNLKT